MQEIVVSRRADATPHAAALIEGLRDIGYSLETAISDILDNSITAGAHRIQIITETFAEEPYIAIVDDGAGMAEAQWDDEMESLPLSAQQEGGVTMAFSTGDDPTGQQILTIGADGHARFTFHKTDPISSTSYLGSCEVSK